MKKIFSLILLLSLACQVNAKEGTESSSIKLERHFVFDTVPLNLEEITSASDRIFTGTCINVEEIEEDPESKLPVFKYTFKITESIKGLEGKEQVTFKQWKPTAKDAGYEMGKKYILFLYPNSERGLTSPVGFLQGQFEIEKKGLIRRKEVVRNKSSNRGLNRNLRTQKKVVINEDKYINDYVESCSELGIPMRYQEFVKAVRYLVRREK
jgi:hypothetical protein